VQLVNFIIGWVVLWLLFMGAAYLGFRAGRMTIDRPMAPILPGKQPPVMIDEDPYYEPMHGKPQPRIPTMPGEKGE
jgi:hypothetical protein